MIKFKNLINRKLLKEGVLDGISASFIVDSGLNESSVQGYKKSLALPRYSLWGFHSQGNGTPKLMENGYDVNTLMEKYGIDKEDVYPIEGSMQETIKKIGGKKWGVYTNGGKKLGIHNDKESAKNQQLTIDSSKSKNKIVKKTSLRG